ncbi:MAG: HypC/HybG/HupF family hydrogenase formation chaperone [Candidatus Melainabacteria bacterium]|jgi:hydrogenase expression/formation protein HypC|nr:HypC/HybG/HupF family hydrogenase formation chaperone [Candidatus Melainabacteria bacterium]MBX9673768.1 HypC/HybG/HupF family hydrogenase formation chaperone [Candidatus Obscuribacterales bacterium]
MCLGIPGQIVEIIDAEKKLGKADVSGVKRVINLACIVDEDNPIQSTIGQWVLIHVGFAMSKIDEQEASRTLQLLNELGEAQREILEMELKQQ